MNRWGWRCCWLVTLSLACGASDRPPATETASSTGGSGSGSTVAATSSTGVPPETFGVDGMDEGSEVGFVPPLDVACAGTPGTSPHCALCSVREQNCVDDFKCVAYAEDGGDAWTGTRCVERARAPVGPGDACTVDEGPASGLDDCEAGSMCWDVDPATGQGTCVPYCGPAGRGPECPAGLGCMIDGPEALALCLPPCDPLLLSACSAGQTCRYFPASQAASCIPDRGGQVLSPTIQCGSEQEACSADEVCVTAATFGGCGAPTCCTPWCDRADPGADRQCAAERPQQQCVPLFDRRPIPKAYPNLGFCGAPPR